MAILCVLLASPVSALAERVVVVKDTQLRVEPKFDSGTTVQVKRGAIMDATAKQGPWLRVNANGKEGWVLTTELSFSPVGKIPDGAANSALFIGRGVSRTTSVSTIGIRCVGDHPADFKTPVNEAQLALLDSYAASREAAYTQHAEPTGLSPLEVPLP